MEPNEASTLVARAIEMLKQVDALTQCLLDDAIVLLEKALEKLV